jgi:multiple sugar transport system permease protein
MKSVLARRILRPSYRSQLGVLLAPFVIGMFLLVFVPMAITLVLGFTEFDLFSAPRWNEFQNVKNWLVDQLFQRALYNSAWFVLIAVPLRVLGALLLAMFLDRSGRAFGAGRAVVYLPTMMPEVAYALVWLLILNPGYGAVNLLLNAFGLPGVAWTLTPLTARATIVVMWLFQLGEGFVLMLAALQLVPRDVLEVALVDGANRWQRFRSILLPFLAPALLLLAFRDIALSFQGVFVAGLITTETGPYYTTYFLPHYVFDEAFGLFRYGYASATTALVYVVTVAIVAGLFFIVRRWRREDAFD